MPQDDTTPPGGFFDLDTPRALQAAWLAWAMGLLKGNELPFSGNVDQWIRTTGQVGLLNFNITGSGDPALERDIGAKYSYGRQLGRMLDMLTPLVEKNRALLVDEAGEAAVQAYEQMTEDIAKMKLKSVADVVTAVKGWQSSPDFAEQVTELLQQLQALVPAVPRKTARKR
jgi:hypothetical protein